MYAKRFWNVENGHVTAANLPNFLVIGSQKAGTTMLYHALRAHPNITMPNRKEINYFFHERLYERGTAFYSRFFDDAPTKLQGEASPGYICHPDAPTRIADTLPDVRVIVTVRHPVDRAYSQYWDNRRHLSEHRTFEQCVAEDLQTDYVPGTRGYFSRGLYAKYISRFLDLFGHDRVFVVVFEDLITDAEAVVASLYRFLGAEPSSIWQAETMSRDRRNAARTWANPVYRTLFRYPTLARFIPNRARILWRWGPTVPAPPPPLDAQLRGELLQFYAPYNRDLFNLIDRVLEHWDS